MAPTLLHLPNGQIVTVLPVFAGFSFKPNDLNIHHSFFPPGWTVILESTVDDDADLIPGTDDPSNSSKHYRPHRFREPTLHNDHLFISSISNPSNIDFKPATSPTRQIAMMLWVTLCWYFHQVLLPPRIPRILLIPRERLLQIPGCIPCPVGKPMTGASHEASGALISNEMGSSREGTCCPS